LRALDAPAYARLAALTERLAAGLGDAAGAAERTVRVQSVPGLLTIFFTADLVVDYGGAARSDLEAYAVWCRALLARGVYPPPSQFEAWFPSLAHTDEDVELVLAAAGEAFAER
jgi:glutamate-1-semialdehyde 2,1-aminomutase